MTKAAVIVETRPNGLQAALDRHLPWLDGWDLWAFCSISSINQFIDYGVDMYIRGGITINSLNDYNRLLTSESFWNQLVQYDKVLIFQTDSGILRPGIEDFFEWDYVGAPWKFQDHGGNGGFSLRTPSVMLEIIQGYPWSPQLGYEDVYFCNEMKVYGIGKLAPREVCFKFSMETIFELGTLGYHAITNYHGRDQVKQILNQYEP